MSDSIIERLRHHAKDERNTAFARSTMREAITELNEWGKLRDPAVLHSSLCRGVPAQLDRDALLHLAGVEQLRAELAASRHELVGAKKSARAQARTIESLQQQREHLNTQRDQWVEARDTLDSERAANARLTEELAASHEWFAKASAAFEREEDRALAAEVRAESAETALATSREREAQMLALIADDSYAMTFQSFGQYRTALLRELAEGAQG